MKTVKTGKSYQLHRIKEAQTRLAIAPFLMLSALFCEIFSFHITELMLPASDQKNNSLVWRNVDVWPRTTPGEVISSLAQQSVGVLLLVYVPFKHQQHPHHKHPPQPAQMGFHNGSTSSPLTT